MVAVSAHLQLAFKWLEFLNNRDYDGMTSITSDKFLNIERPASMGYPPRNRSEYIQAVSVTPVKFFNISLPTPENTVDDGTKVMFYTSANGTTDHGFPWKNEYMWTFTYEKDKILSVTWFVDPTIVAAMFTNETVAAQAELNCLD